MFMPFFTSFIIFVLVINHAIRKNDRLKAEGDAAFWKKEHDANFVRKKPLDDLNYISIPIEALPFGALQGDPEAADAERTLKSLAGEKIVNLTGISNTDLKLRYGTANITPLTEYDSRYMELARVLQKWAKRLSDNGLWHEAHAVLDFAIDTKTDISQSWHLYIECVCFHLGLSPDEAKRTLIEKQNIASSLSSLSREGITKELNESIESIK